MAVYELTYQRLTERPQRHDSPALAIAQSDLRVLFRRRSLRLAFFLLGALTLMLTLYVVARNGVIDQLVPEAWRGFSAKLPPIDAAFFDWVLRFSLYQYLLFFLALFAGSGRIAEDLRSNALAIYLAKPLTRGEYLAGKVGTTAAIVGIGTLGTPLVVYLIAVLTTPGFLTGNLRIGATILAVGLLATAYHTAAILFFSSLVKSGRLAALLFAGLYFMTGKVQFVTDLALRTNRAAFIGYAKNIDTVTAHLLGTAGAKDAPLLPALAVIVLVVVLGLGFARRRVQAVEVVR